MSENHKMTNLQNKIGYDVDINQSDKRIKKVLIIMKNYLNKCEKLVIAVDAGNVNIDESDKLIEEFKNEIDKLRQTEGKSTTSTEVGSRLWTWFTFALYEWSLWLLNKIKDLLTT